MRIDSGNSWPRIIGLLADSFNGMLTEIERRTQTLEQSNVDLEREIGERTRAEGALLVACYVGFLVLVTAGG